MNILKNSQFLKLWGNQVLLQVAFNMSNFSALLLIDHISNSRFALAQFYAAMTLPAFLVGLFAGAIVDMTNRKNLMLITDFLLSLLFFSYVLVSGNYWVLLLIGFLSASVAQFFTPAEAATIPLIVKEEQLESANALFLFTQLGSVMAGYALAGPVIAFFGGVDSGGATFAFALAGILTVIGFILRLSLKTIEMEKPEISSNRIFFKTFEMIKDVTETVRSNVKISLPIGLLTLMEFNIGMLSILFLSFVKEYLFLPTTSISYFLIAPLIVGLIIGVFLLNRLKIKKGFLIFLGGISFGLVIFGLGLAANLIHSLDLLKIVTIFAAFTVGMAAVFVAVHARTILQENTPENMLGRVFSLVTISVSAITPVPILIVALITEKLDVATIFIVFGLLLTLGILALGPILNREIK